MVKKIEMENNPKIFQLVPEASVVSGSEDSTPSPISGDNNDDDDDDDDHELYVAWNEIMFL